MFRGLFRAGSTILTSTVHRTVPVRSIYGVRHNPKRGIFYVPLKDDEAAVLRYKADGNVLDMLSIKVPQEYRGRGLARLLAEAAITYAIVHDYYIWLTCKYMQKFYRATKNPELEKRVIGPKHILEDPESEHLDPETVYNLTDPEDPSPKR